MPTMDLGEALERWHDWDKRAAWQRVAAKAAADGNTGGEVIAEEAFDGLLSITGLQALEANAQAIVRLESVQWQAVQAAREEGAAWDEIGAALGVTRQSAWSRFKTKLEAQEQRPPDLRDAARGRAALGDQPAP